MSVTKTLWLGLLLVAFDSGCGGTTPTTSTEATAPASVQPNLAQMRAHIEAHVQKYPATRAEILATCADTPEFSAAEKQWFEDNLPEGTYASAEEVLSALKV